MRGASERLVVGWVTLALAGVASGDCPDDTADSVLGQSDMSSSIPNQPAGVVSAGGLALSNAAGIAVARGGRLYASDPDNNRVLSWPSATAFSVGEPADLVFGQPDFASNVPNNGGVSAHSLNLPQGVWVDPNDNLWVTDAFNHRVLKFADPLTDATPFDADLVIGQPDLQHNDENLGLGGDGPHVALPDSLQFPGRVIVAPGRVFVADSGNSRVLGYSMPLTNKPLADVVFGQYGNFFCRGKNNDGTCENGFTVTAENMKNPIGIACDRDGRLFVADWANNRILRFDPPWTDTVADAVYGQPDFMSSLFNNGGAAAGLGLPIDVALDPGGALFVADSGNNRVVTFDDPLIDAAPTCVLGQLGSLSATDANHGLGFFFTDAQGLFGPTGVALDHVGNAYIADTNNQRLLRFVRGCGFGDMNEDGVIDANDLQVWTPAMAGPSVTVPPAGIDADVFACADLHRDGDVDLADFANMQVRTAQGE